MRKLHAALRPDRLTLLGAFGAAPTLVSTTVFQRADRATGSVAQLVLVPALQGAVVWWATTPTGRLVWAAQAQRLDDFNSEVKMKLKRVRKARWDVLATCGPRGDCPLLEFVAGLEAQLATDGRAMLRLLSFVAEQGPPRNVDVSHKISGEIWELIAGRLRVLWFYDEGRLVVCSHGFVKRTRKTPASEIDRAQASYEAYQVAKDAKSLRVED